MSQKSSAPSAEFAAAANAIRLHLACSVAAICHGTLDDQGLAELEAKLKARDDACRGNRPAAAYMTWDDLRLLFIGSLEVCLEHLEQHPPK